MSPFKLKAKHSNTVAYSSEVKWPCIFNSSWQRHSLILATKINHQRTSEGMKFPYLYLSTAFTKKKVYIYIYGPTVTRTGKTSSASYQWMAEVIRIVKTSDSTNTLTGTASRGWHSTYNWVHSFWNIRPPDSHEEKCRTLIWQTK